MIGIYGGTFDPVHFGHLRPALDVITQLGLSEIRLLPCGQPAHRQMPIASAEHRYAMLALAIEHVSGLKLDDRELKRSGPAFMIDTIVSLQDEFKDENFCLIIGMDAFLKFESWKEWQTILQRVNLVVTHRPNFDLESIPASGLKEYVNTARTDERNRFIGSSHGHCYCCPVTQLDISATQIRELIAQGQSAEFLLPTPVIQYIEQHNLYK